MSDTTGSSYDSRAAKKPKAGKPALKEINISRAANGGFIATHRFDNSGDGPYKDSEPNTFDKGPDLLAHVAKHFGIKAPAAAAKAAPVETSPKVPASGNALMTQ